MEQITTGFETGEFTQLLVIAVALVVVLVFARIAFKLTATLFRIGCGVILLIAAAFALIYYLN